MSAATGDTRGSEKRGLTRRDVLLVSGQATVALALARCGGGGAGVFSSLGGGSGKKERRL